MFLLLLSISGIYNDIYVQHDMTLNLIISNSHWKFSHLDTLWTSRWTFTGTFSCYKLQNSLSIFPHIFPRKSFTFHMSFHVWRWMLVLVSSSQFNEDRISGARPAVISLLSNWGFTPHYLHTILCTRHHTIITSDITLSINYISTLTIIFWMCLQDHKWAIIISFN